MIPSNLDYPVFNLQPELDFRTHMLNYLSQFYCMPDQEKMLVELNQVEATKSEIEWESVSYNERKKVGRPRKSLTDSYEYIYS